MRSRRGDSPSRRTRRRPSRPPTPPRRAPLPRPPPRTPRRPTRKPTGSFHGRSTSSGAPAAAAGVVERAPAGPADKADFVLVLKAPRRLLLLRGPRVLREYEIALGRSPAGPKRNRRDARTPEGRYRIDARVADSRFHRA